MMGPFISPTTILFELLPETSAETNAIEEAAVVTKKSVAVVTKRITVVDMPFVPLTYMDEINRTSNKIRPMFCRGTL
jgi:hypothetical protein